MPIITIKLLEGRTKEQKRVAAKQIADAAAKTLNTKIDRVTIVFEDMKKENYAPKGEQAE